MRGIIARVVGFHKRPKKDQAMPNARSSMSYPTHRAFRRLIIVIGQPSQRLDIPPDFWACRQPGRGSLQ
jgi:hypothetical protein